MKAHGLAAVVLVVSAVIAGCGAPGEAPALDGDSGVVLEEVVEFADLAAGDLDLNFLITEQRYFAVWNVAWIIRPQVREDVLLQPESSWLVIYRTTVPDSPRFVGATDNFTVQVDASGDVSYSGDGLEVGSHGINAHPDRLVVEIVDIVRR